jgi:HEPN domain-containing protein
MVLVVRYCQIKSYIRAHNHYLELTITDERYWDAYDTGRNLHAEYVNDETRRRISQNLKRMLTLCQKLHPADPAKTVNFAA